MSNVSVSPGQAIEKGQQIGKIGNTGYSFGAHLHFGVYRGTYSDANAINPLLLYR